MNGRIDPYREEWALVAYEAEFDPRPSDLFSPAGQEWQRRQWSRDARVAELRDAELLTTDPRDPAPLGSRGLAAFLEWARRRRKA